MIFLSNSLKGYAVFKDRKRNAAKVIKEKKRKSLPSSCPFLSFLSDWRFFKQGFYLASFEGTNNRANS